MKTILIVEDNKPIRYTLSFLLSGAGYETIEAEDAMSAMDETSCNAPDLALLDWTLPDMDGMKLMKVWKADETTARMPVIIVSARAKESDRVTALKAGADDYVTKPFSRNELLARIEAVLRRSQRHGDSGQMLETRSFAGLELDMRSLRVLANEKPVHLGPIEFKLLNLFMSNPDRAFTRPQIVTRIWRSNTYVEDRTVDVHVRRLRRALEDTGHDKYIQTVRGVGYRFSGTDRLDAAN